MRFDSSVILALSLCEVVALAVIAHLWLRKRRMRIITRALWSLVLLVPLFGVLFYGLTRSDPDAHSDEVPDHGSDATPD
jgi:hypothetical protein